MVEPAELRIRNGSNASLRCNTNNGVPDTSIYWEKLSGRANCPNINTDSASETGHQSGFGLSLSGSGRQSGFGLSLSGSGSSGLLSGDGELEQYQLVGNGSEFDFAPVMFGDETKVAIIVWQWEWHLIPLQ